jgi:peptidoglycan/LPS O-acetylase OafA/YrhL
MRQSTLLQGSSTRIPFIQGLRGLAVSLVVLYHAGFLFNGGFIGVDIFFVISGFVIGQSLSREIVQTGRVSWSQFFFRRARRLIPAHSLTLFITVIAYWVLFGVESVATLTKSLTSGSLFVSNFYFFLERGYVDLASDPLRNLWSLSVEEQFYFALPIIFLTAGFKSTSNDQVRRKLLLIGFVVMAISFVANVILVNHSLTFSVPQFLLPGRFAFFSPFTRAWEFLVGLLLALLGKDLVSKVWYQFAGGLSIAGLIFAAWWLDSWQPFPGWFALPVVMASAILMLNSDQKTWFTKLLSTRPLVYLGDISYSLYLLHWPFLVIAKQKFGDEDRIVLIAVLLSIFSSIAVYKFVEDPFRRKSWEKRKVFALLIAGFVLLPIFIVRVPPNFVIQSEIPTVVVAGEASENDFRSSRRNLGSTVCLDAHKQGLLENVSKCVEGSDESMPLVFLLGDSHAYSASEGVIAAAKRNGFRVMTWSRSGCPFLITSSVNRLCNYNRDGLLNAIKSERPAAVLIVNGVNHYFEGVPDESFLPRGIRARIKSVAASYGETIEFLLQSKVPAALMYEVPNMSRDERELSEFLLRREIVKAIERQIGNAEERYGLKVSRVDPADLLCRDGVCRSYDSAGNLLYLDGQHINADGALLISRLFDDVFMELKK